MTGPCECMGRRVAQHSPALRGACPPGRRWLGNLETQRLQAGLSTHKKLCKVNSVLSCFLPNWGVLDELYALYEQSRCPVRLLLCYFAFKINGTQGEVVGSEGPNPPS
jgi:hypothetical protein